MLTYLDVLFPVLTIFMAILVILVSMFIEKILRFGFKTFFNDEEVVKKEPIKDSQWKDLKTNKQEKKQSIHQPKQIRSDANAEATERYKRRKKYGKPL